MVTGGIERYNQIMKNGWNSLIRESGLTRRWLKGSLLSIVLMILVAEGLFLGFYFKGYYNDVRQNISMQFSTMLGQLNTYSGENEEAASYIRGMVLRRMVEQFSAKDKYEFMLLDARGDVIASTSGVDVSGIIDDRDFAEAQRNGVEGEITYRTEAREWVMSVCMLLPVSADDVAALRMVTSLTLVDRRLYQAMFLSILVAATMLGGAVASGLYFVRSIVKPLGEMEKAAAAITAGDLTVRLPVAGDLSDEIDHLSDSINQMAEGLAEMDRIKNEFISSVSHELRTPLTSIKGWIETLGVIQDPSDENYRKGLSIISSEADRLYGMVEELLDFSRIQNGRLPIDPQPLDLVAEVTDAVLFLQPRCSQNGIELMYDEPMDTIPVFADPDRMRQVFINVMDNAVKYSVHGGRITVKVWAGKKKAFVEIFDQGRGISPSDLNNVKSKFYKGKNAVLGSGIGLALVDELMTVQGGTLDIRSTLGKGTVVTLGLPLYYPDRDPQPPTGENNQ